MNRNSNRRATAVAALTAAALFATTAERSSAQVWNNPTTGNWNNVANWIGGIPASANTTALTFNSTGVQTYTATNDLGNPFVLNSMTFGAASSNAINIAGTQLSFQGVAPSIVKNGAGPVNISTPIQIASGADQTALTVGGTGSGVLTFSGAFSSSPAATAALGGYLFLNNPNLSTTISGGGSLYSLDIGQGSATMTGGTLALTSGERGNDPVTPVADGGVWGFALGETSGQTARFTQTGGTINGGVGGFVANQPGSIGIATFTGATTVANFTNGRFGVNFGNGSISVLAGAKVNTRLIEGGRNAGATSNILVDGAGSQINGLAGGTAGQLFLGRPDTTNSTLTISNGGFVRVDAAPTIPTTATTAPNGQIITGAMANGLTTIKVLSGGSLALQGNMFVNTAAVTGTGDPLDTTAIITVDGANSQLNVATFQQNNGTTAFTGGQLTMAASNGGTATAIFSNGGSGSANNTFIGNGGVSTGGVGTIIISSGGTFTNHAQLTIESQDNPSAVKITGGEMKMDGAGGGTFVNAFMSTNAGDKALLDISGATARFTQTGAATFLIMSGGGGAGVAGGTSTVSIASGGGMTIGNGGMFVATNPNGLSTVSVGGANSFLKVGDAGVGSGDFIIGDDVNAKGTLNVTNGGSVNIGRGLFMATTNDVGGIANGTATIDGANSRVVVGRSLVMSGGNINPDTGDALPAGVSTLTVSNGGTMSTQNAFIAENPSGKATMNVTGTNSRVTVDAGAGTSNLVLADDDATVGTININTGGTVAVVGNSFLSPALNSTSTVNVVGGTFTNSGQLQVGGSGTIDGGASTVNINGNGFVSASGGTSSLTAVFTPGVINIGSGTSKGILQSGQAGTFVDGTINFNAGTFNTVGTLGVGGSVILSSAARNGAGTPTNKKFIEAGRVDMTTSGVIDLNDNDMLLHNDTVANVQGFVAAARNGGLWNQPGITSSAAKVTAHRNLGVVSGADYLSAGVTTFNGKTVVAGDTLVKFTFNGDTDLNGTVDFDDYSHVDNGFNNNRTGWFNGDFDYNGTVDFDDYSLIDQAFNNQGAVVLGVAGGLAGPGERDIVRIGTQDLVRMMNPDGTYTLIAATSLDHTDAVGMNGGPGAGNLQAVPEPTTLSVIGLGMLGALRRRRRHA